jgi:hypothetical protein
MGNARLKHAGWMMAALAILASLPLAPAALAVEVKKPAAPDPKATAAVSAAATALVKEVQANAKDPNVKLRDKSDYFGATPPAEVTPEAILAALERQQNGDARIDAYVKWQLLSGVSGPFPAELAARALAVYRRAPEPFNHPGLDKNRLTSALFQVGAMKKERMDDVNKGFGESIEKNHAANFPILKYRKELYSRLPVSGDSLMAGLEDVFARVRHGIQAGDQFEAISGSIQSWSLTAESRQREAIIQALGKLLITVRDARSKPFVKVTWNDDPKNLGMHWQDEGVLDEGKIQGLIDSLREAGKMLGNAGFKDPPKK